MKRRQFLVGLGALTALRGVSAQDAVTRPVISEADSPTMTFEPVASDGYRGLGVLRKPPGDRRYPAVLWVPAGLTSAPLVRLQGNARNLAFSSRFLAAGYAFAATSYRSRDVDPQSPLSLRDVLAAADYVRRLPYVDGDSVVLFGCSGGGDLALAAAASQRFAAVVAEEPASVLISGVLNTSTPKKGERYTPDDAVPLLRDGRKYYSTEMQQRLRARIAAIDSPILLIQGDVDRADMPVNRFNADVLIPEFRAAGKALEVKTYPGQPHCFCSTSGQPTAGRYAAPASWPAVALEAYVYAERFCASHVRTKAVPVDSSLVRHEEVPQAR
jgi:dienelactone hydrolase